MLSSSTRIGGVTEKKGECTRSVLKIGRSQDKAHHLEQQDMWMIVRASQEDVEGPQGN